MFDLTFLFGQMPTLLSASVITVVLTLLTLVLAAVIALPFAVVRESRSPLAPVVAAYSWLLLTTPSLLVLYFAYYALPSFGVLLPAFQTAVVAMAVSSSAYQIEIFRAGIISLQRGQFEAARALGIPEWRIWWRIVLPQALIVVIPPYISNATSLLKGTSLAALVTVPEVSGVGMGLISFTYRPFEILTGVSVIYLALNSVLTGLQAVVERRLTRR